RVGPGNGAVSTGGMPFNRTNTTTPWPMPSTAATAAGQSSMEMDRRFCEAFDLITRQVAAVSFLQFIKCNSVPAGARVPRQPNGLGRKRATSYPEDQQG